MSRDSSPYVPFACPPWSHLTLARAALKRAGSETKDAGRRPPRTDARHPAGSWGVSDQAERIGLGGRWSAGVRRETRKAWPQVALKSRRPPGHGQQRAGAREADHLESSVARGAEADDIVVVGIVID